MASVKQSLIRRYGEEEGLIKWKEQCKKYGRNKEQYILEHGINAWEKLRKTKATHTKQHFIDKYGSEWEIKWREHIKKKLKTEKERYPNGIGHKTALTIENLQRKYGIEEGYKKWKRKCEMQKYRFSKQYYIDKYGIEQGEVEWKNYCKSMDKGSINYFIEKYGKEIGNIKWRELNERKKIQKKN